MSDKLRRVMMVILACVFLICACVFGKSLWEYHKGNQIYEASREFIVETEAGTPVEQEKMRYEKIDFPSLQAVNEDIFGWITIPETVVDYPLLDADDIHYYLERAYDRQWSSYGSIFLDPRNIADLQDRHIVIYGHNMRNKSMFGSLMEYKKQEYADAHDTIYISLADRDLTYRVFSAYTAHVDSATYYMDFYDDAAFQQMLDQMKNNSLITSDVTPTVDDQILTLSTCTPAGDTWYRFVVNAVLVEDSAQTEEMENAA